MGGSSSWLKELPPSLMLRYWRKVDMQAEASCWVWRDNTNVDGYGVFQIGSMAYLAHRLAWMFANDQELPSEFILLHSCDNRLCCNPTHLSVGTRTLNNLDKVNKGRHKGAVGELNRSALLTETIIKTIYWKFLKLGVTRSQLATEYQVSITCIQRILQGKTWPHLYHYYRAMEVGDYEL